MTKYLPSWAYQAASPQDYQRVLKAQEKNYLKYSWAPDYRSREAWMKKNQLEFSPSRSDAEILNLILNEENFYQSALKESGLQLMIPIQHYKLSPEKLAHMDACYEKTNEQGQLIGWTELVNDLRNLFRLIDAGVTIQIGKKHFEAFTPLYSWAYARYRALEEGYDEWFASI